MLILLDQGTPVPIRSFLRNHTVKTAAQQGWSTLRNSQLLESAEDARFDLLLSTDKNLVYQQNLAGRKIAVVVLGILNGRSCSAMSTGSWPPLTWQPLAATRKSTYRTVRRRAPDHSV